MSDGYFKLPYENFLWIKNGQPVEGTDRTDSEVLGDIDKIGRLSYNEDLDKEESLDPAYEMNQDGAVNGLLKQVLKNQLAIQERLNNQFRVGDIYISTSSESPKLRFGGEWENIGARFLVGSGTMTWYKEAVTKNTVFPSNTWALLCDGSAGVNRSSYSDLDSKAVFTFPGNDGFSDPGRAWYQYGNVRMYSPTTPSEDTDVIGDVVVNLKIKDDSYMEPGGPSWSLYSRNFNIMLSDTTGYDFSGINLGKYNISIGQLVDISVPVNTTKKYSYIKLVASESGWDAECRLVNKFSVYDVSIVKTTSDITKTKDLVVGEQGGEHVHQLTVGELPSSFSTNSNFHVTDKGAGGGHALDGFISTDPSSGLIGGDQPHNNLPPYFVVNIWRKIAN